MGWLYDHSLYTLVALSVATQLAAAPMFVVIGRRLARARAVRPAPA